MTTPLPGNTSATARLLNAAPSFAVGWQELIKVPPPAAGATFTYTSDGRYFERVLAVNFTLTTSAVVANRVVTVALKTNNGDVVTEVPGSGTVVASSVLTAALHINGPSYAAAASGLAAGFLPDILIPPGYTWSPSISGIDVGDTLTAVTVLVQRFPNDAAQISAVG